MSIEDQQVADDGSLVLSVKAWTKEREYFFPYRILKEKIAETSLEVLRAKVLQDLDEKIAADLHREHMLSFYQEKQGLKMELRK